MNATSENLDILMPRHQLKLFGYNDYFNSFIKLYRNNKLPNTILFSGPKGLGKSTFAYHFINYILSINEKDSYSIENYSIKPENLSFKSVCNLIHPNFYLIENEQSKENIKIESVRNTIKYLNKSTISSNIKIILIDNAEFLNISASNALLKALEENNDRTFFFIIHNNSSKIVPTIKSRCIEFKFFFNFLKKKEILKEIITQYNSDIDINQIDENFYFDTPGNIFKYLLILNQNNIDFSNDKLKPILELIDIYLENNDLNLLSFISTLIEIYYNDLALKNENHLNLYFINKFKILNLIHNFRKFNLDKKNIFISIRGILENEKK